MTPPLVVEFAVDASVEHAFAVWVRNPDRWWPKSKTVSRDSLDEVVIEPVVGGRIYERNRDGDEHDWGRVVVWEPPTRIGFTWHLFFDPAEATDVSITFRPDGAITRVRLEQTGWDRLGAGGGERRTNTIRAWESITPLYAAAAGASIEW